MGALAEAQPSLHRRLPGNCMTHGMGGGCLQMAELCQGWPGGTKEGRKTIGLEALQRGVLAKVAGATRS